MMVSGCYNLFSFERSDNSQTCSLKTEYSNMIFLLKSNSKWFHQIEAIVTKIYSWKLTMKPKFYEVKLIRAYSECLGIRRRWRTWLPAKSDGELVWALIRWYPNGGTQYELCHIILLKTNRGREGRPGELKHLSTRRKRKRNRFRQ